MPRNFYLLHFLVSSCWPVGEVPGLKEPSYFVSCVLYYHLPCMLSGMGHRVTGSWGMGYGV